MQPRYLNIDLVITSALDLTPLANSFGDSVLVLSNDWADGSCRAVLELSYDADDAPADATKFCQLLEDLEGPALVAWQSAESRVFDFGFESGEDGNPAYVIIPSELAKRMSSLGCSIGITVYPRKVDSEGQEQES